MRVKLSPSQLSIINCHTSGGGGAGGGIRGDAARQIACKVMNLIRVYLSLEKVLLLLFLLQFLYN